MDSLLIELTDKCNLNCSYCFKRERDKHKEKIKVVYENDFSNLVEIAKDSSIKKVTLSGGEPLLYKNFEGVVQLLSDKELVLLTNGIEKIENRDILEKLNIVVSLDGNYDIMNKHRGIDKADFFKIIQNIRWYIEYAKTTSINTVITSYNLNEKEYFPFELFKEKSFYRFSAPSVAFTPPDLCLPVSRYGDVKKVIETYLEKYNYHVPASINVVNKRYVKDNLADIVENIAIPEFHLSDNRFYVFNRQFRTLQEIRKNIGDIQHDIKNLLLEYLENPDCPTLIEPYSYIENILYNV